MILTRRIALPCPLTLAVVAWVMLAAFATSSLDAAEFSGSIRDTQGLTVVGVRVAVRTGDDTAPVRRTTTTDSLGQFRFDGVASGTYELEAYSPGFERRTVTVQVEDAGTDLQIELQPAGLHEGIVVTAARQETDTSRLPLPTALVSDRRLGEYMPTNLAQALTEVPGVTWRGAGPFRSRPVIRGLDSNRILVLVDGERLNNNRTSTGQGGIETSLVDVSNIQQVEVVRGPGSVLYGSDAFGGVVNIRTRNAQPRDDIGFGARLGATSFPNSNGVRANTELSAGNRWFSAWVQGSTGSMGNYRSPASEIFFSGVDKNSAAGALRFFVPSDQTFSFQFLHRAGNNFGLPSFEENPVFLAEFPYSKIVKYSGGYQKSFRSPALSSIQAKFYTQNQSRNFSNRILAGPTVKILSTTETDVQSSGLDVQATSLPAPTHVLTYGISYYRDRNRDFRLQTLIGAGPSPRVLDAAPSVPDSSFSGTGFFFQDQFQATSRARITAGLRADHFELKTFDTLGFDPDVAAAVDGGETENAISGNIGASIDVGRGWLVSGNVGRAFRAPNLFERYFFGRGSVGGFIVPNPSLQPETSLQLDTGVHFRSAPVKISVNYFLNSLNNLISSAPGTFNGAANLSGQTVFQNINVLEARIQGIESTTEYSVSGLGSQWALTFSAAWQRGDNRGSGEPLSLIAPFIGQARLRWAPRRTRLWSEFGSFLVSGSDRVPAGATPIRGYTTFGWRTGYNLVRGERGLAARLPAGISAINFHAGMENVGNRTYFGLFETVHQPGRDFRFGIDLIFNSNAL